MIEIKRKNQEPLVFEEATTVKEAVEYAVRNHISLEEVVLSGENLSRLDLSYINLSGADLSYAYISHSDLSYTNLSGADVYGADLHSSVLSNADLSNADISGADISGADLSHAKLTGTDLSGANIDFSGLPLCCGSLNVKIDKRIFCQLLYHALRAGKSVDDEEVKKILSIPEVVKLANQFHRVQECGKI